MPDERNAERPLHPDIDALCREHANKWKVSAVVHPRDFIFHFLLKDHSFCGMSDDAVKYYFDDGRKSAELLRSILENDLSVDVAERKQMLEFASGYGAVTRHLRAVLPAFDITSSDIHLEANDFVATVLGGRAVPSSSVPECFDAAGEYDFVFALSFFSHMPKATFLRWLRALFKALRVGGSLIFTAHGATTLRKVLPEVVLDDEGFYFRPQSEQDDLEKTEYGTAVTSNKFVVERLENLENCELRLIRAGLWWGHQDLYAASKIASAAIAPVADYNIYQTDDKAAGHVESVSIVDKKCAAQTRRIVRARGWATPDVKGDRSADSIIVLIRTDDGVHSCQATRCDRHDVARALGNPALVETGFNAEVDISALSGKLTLLVAIRSGSDLKICRNIAIPLGSLTTGSRSE